MFRVLNFVSVLALLAAAGAVYHVKYSSTFEAQRIAKVRADIRSQRDRIAMLNAEWARRTAPDRIQSLAEHHLDMQPLDVDRIDTLASLPARPEQNSDALGGMIEALVDGPLLTGSLPPADKPKPSSAPSSAPAAAAPAAPRLPSAGASTTPPASVIPLQQAAQPATQPTARAPLPLSAMPSAGVMAPGGGIGHGVPAPYGQPLVAAPVTSAAPLLPPASVGQ